MRVTKRCKGCSAALLRGKVTVSKRTLGERKPRISHNKEPTITDQFNNQNGYTPQSGQPYQQPNFQHSYQQPVVNPQQPHPAKPSTGRTFGTAFAGAALACVIAFGGFTVYQNVTETPSGSNVTLGASTNTEIQAQSTDDTLPEAVAQKCLPSVAAIDVYTQQTSTDMLGRSTSSSGTLTESSLGSGVVL